MWLWIALVGLVVLSIPIWIGLQRGPELFVIDVKEGQSRLLRGRIPPRLLLEIDDILKRNRVRSGRIRVALEGGHPRTFVDEEFPAAALQQIRNVVGMYQAGQLRAGTRRP